MKISVVIPVRNEQDSIRALLDGLLCQTLKPDEIVITDGGSTDATISIISEYLECGVPLRLIESDLALPGRGRNLAAALASGDWLACIDAGIIPDPAWLQELLNSADKEKEAQVVFGGFRPVIRNYFSACAAITYLPPLGTLVPSIASCLMKRSVWESVGGFREDLRSAEDIIFFRELDRHGVRHTFSEKAIVHWELQPDIGATFRRFATYSRSAMKAGLAHDWQVRVTQLYLVMAIMLGSAWFWLPLGLLPIVLLLFRAQRRIYRWYTAQTRSWWTFEVLNPRRVLTVVWINFVIDLAMFRGMLEWLLRDRIGDAQPSEVQKSGSA